MGCDSGDEGSDKDNPGKHVRNKAGKTPIGSKVEGGLKEL